MMREVQNGALASSKFCSAPSSSKKANITLPFDVCLEEEVDESEGDETAV